MNNCNWCVSLDIAYILALMKRVEADEASAIPVHGFARCLNAFAINTRQCSITRASLAVVQHDMGIGQIRRHIGDANLAGNN